MYGISFVEIKNRLPLLSSCLEKLIFCIFIIPLILCLLAPKVSAEPTTFEVQVAASSDDAEERADGRMKLTSSDLELVFDKNNQIIGMRFTGVAIPTGAGITEAYIQFQADEATSEATLLTIEGEAVDNASMFSNSSRDISLRSRTKSSVAWSPEPWTVKGEVGPAQRTPSISSIIQEIVNRPGWMNGNSLVIIITGTGERVAESFDGDQNAAPLLHVVYSEEGNTFPTVSITEPADNANFAVEEAVTFTGTASDVEDGDLSTNLAWNSDRDGSIGTGSLVTTSSLTEGVHTITASISDSGGLEGSTQIMITVGEVPTTLEVRVSASSDDAEERASGSMKLASSDLELVFDNSDQIIGVRFNEVTIPHGASIEQAYIQLQTDEISSDITSLTIEGELTGNAATFNSSRRNISMRFRTSNNISWSPPAWMTVGEAGPDQQSPDITPIIQEIVNQSEWSSGNSLVLIISGAGERIAESFDGVSGAAPLLHIVHFGGEDIPPGLPEISAFTPASAQVATVVEISGENFSEIESVAFNGISSSFRVASDSTIYATVPPGETTGLITISNRSGNAISPSEFNLVPSPPVLVGASDLTKCGAPELEETAKLVDAIAGTVITIGDNVDEGTTQEFNDCYEPTWGRHKHRTRPVPGNSEYNTPGAAGYFDYYGPAAGEPDKGYYSYDIGDWHIIALNSECGKVGGCDIDSPQGQWLQADLAQYPASCTLAYWHRALFGSGRNSSSMIELWQVLYDAGVELVLNGHNHNYERFAPQDANGNLDLEQGIRQITVGTGGANLYQISESEIAPNSEVHNDNTHGVLKLILNPGSYEWEFIPIAGQVFTDSGSEPCH